MTKFFTSDTHFNCRENFPQDMGRWGFKTKEEHDGILMENINSKVGRKDELIIVGDFADAKPGKYRALIRCGNVRLVWGNHDCRLKSQHVFGVDIRDILNMKLTCGQRAVLCHYPFAYWNRSHRNWINLFAHMHDQRRETFAETPMFNGCRHLEVSVDSARRHLGKCEPFSEHEIMDIVGDLPGHDPVSFYDQFRLRNKPPEE